MRTDTDLSRRCDAGGRRARIGAVAALLLGTAIIAPGSAWAGGGGGPKGDGGSATYRLQFEPVEYHGPWASYGSNARPGARAELRIRVADGRTQIHFKLRGGYPHTVYTIWTVFWPLQWPLEPFLVNGVRMPGAPYFASYPTPPAGFPTGGLTVGPLGRLDAAYTGGMGLDPGATFVTNGKGDAEFEDRLDYDLTGGSDDGPPVGNGNLVFQCAPMAGALATSFCPAGTTRLNVTGAWLRKFVIDLINEGKHPEAMCANYDPAVESTYPVSAVFDPKLWQCVDPESGLPRVHRFKFDHFRLAPHPDALTHGFLGGNFTDHFIDMVGRRCALDPTPPGEQPCN
jgi:hypothetical protein